MPYSIVKLGLQLLLKSLPGTVQESALTSDAVTILEIHQNFPPLRLLRPSCGMLRGSVLVATAE